MKPYCAINLVEKMTKEEKTDDEGNSSGRTGRLTSERQLPYVAHQCAYGRTSSTEERNSSTRGVCA